MKVVLNIPDSLILEFAQQAKDSGISIESCILANIVKSQTTEQRQGGNAPQNYTRMQRNELLTEIINTVVAKWRDRTTPFNIEEMANLHGINWHDLSSKVRQSMGRDMTRRVLQSSEITYHSTDAGRNYYLVAK